MAEAGFRLLLAFDIKALNGLRNPLNFSDRNDSEDFWGLYHRWNGSLTRAPNRIHPDLGWSQTYVTGQNPLGLEKRTLDQMVPNGKKDFLFYGDSFIKGAASPDYFIPVYMSRMMPGVDVVDFGVGSYGPDQMLLLASKTLPYFEKPVVLAGMLLEDLDRAALQVFSNPKPYFEVSSEGKLILKGVPVPPDPAIFFRNNPPHIRSYLASFFLKRYGKLPQRTERKKQVNGLIIEEFKRLCAQKEATLLYVLFYGQEQLGRTDWRETFLMQELDRRNIPYFDSKTALQEYARKNQVSVSLFYKQGDGHHTDLGNKIIAEALVDYLVQKGYYQP